MNEGSLRFIYARSLSFLLVCPHERAASSSVLCISLAYCNINDPHLPGTHMFLEDN